MPWVRDVPVDPVYLEQQAGPIGSDPIGCYLKHGVERGLNPTRWFHTDWYAWQNPDWVAEATPYQHFLEAGAHQGRDPSPFVDVQRYCEVTGLSAGSVYGAIMAGCRSMALGVYDSARDLELCQRHFLNGIEVVAHRVTVPDTPRKALVVVQAGRGAKVDSWFNENNREWDLLVNYYDAAGFRLGLGDYVFFQKGTKFTAMWAFAKHFNDVLSLYDHVLFLDDDIDATCDGLNRLFRTCRKHDLALAQMSLCERSSCNWPELFSRPGGTDPRATTAVEIMMPVFSRKALQLVRPTLGRSISGYGLDLAWGKIVSEAGGKIAVLDDVVATHERAVDHSGGAYYAYLRRHMINPKAELWVLSEDYAVDLNLSSV